MQLSPQQAAFVEWVKTGEGSAFLEAVAGSGKTTTLINALKETTGTVVFCAYNKAIAAEIEAKVAKLNLGTRIKVATFHSLGYAAVRAVFGYVKCDETTKNKLISRKFGLEDYDARTLRTFVFKLVSLAKQRGVMLDQADNKAIWHEIVDHFDLAYEIEDGRDVERGIDLAIQVLRYGVDLVRYEKLCDFDDMIYIPVVLGLKVTEYDWVFVDEAQDTNAARRMLARKMLKKNGRSAWVGDRHQAIYGFTGADNDAIDQIIRDFNCSLLPLTVTFRCPQAVVRYAQQVVSHIEAAETAPEGIARTSEWDGFTKLISEKAFHATDDAILCRVTKPLVELAYVLIRKGVACHVEGKDIGKGLINLVNRYKTDNLDTLREKLEDFRDREVQKLIAKGRETQAEAMKDRVETIFVIMDAQPPATTVTELRARIESMFLDGDKEPKKTLTLATVHKSKGREWKRVFVLGRNKYMPSKWARQAWQLEQEKNLIYVAYTRAMHELVLVNVATNDGD